MLNESKKSDKSDNLYEIRKPLRAEYSLIADVHLESWRESYRGIMDDAYIDTLTPAMSERLLSSHASANIRVLAYCGRIVGFCLVGHSRDIDTPPSTGELCGLYILRAHQGLGYGRALFDAGKERLASLGYKHYSAWVLAQDERAKGFYLAMGMSFDGGLKPMGASSTLMTARYSMPLMPNAQKR